MLDRDVIILGAGAAGLLCAAEAGNRGRRVLVLEKGKAPGAKIRISGGGRCNFTNLATGPADFLSQNPDFCRSALARFTPWDFIERVEARGIEWHEKTLGQLFCTAPGGAAAIVDLLVDACAESGNVEIACHADVERVERAGPGDGYPSGFVVHYGEASARAASLVVATGGPSIPKMGATGFGYRIAERFGLPVVEPTPALVPFTLAANALAQATALAGVSLPVVARCNKASFAEALLFTHRGLSGPAVLQLSSYWSKGETIEIDLLPGLSLEGLLGEARQATPKRTVATLLAAHLPKRLAAAIVEELGLDVAVGQLTTGQTAELVERIHRWSLRPSGTEGWRTAEVTRGGVSTQALSSKTMESRDVPGLYFIGEVVDVTGHLGGFNFQWAWASGFAAGQYC